MNENADEILEFEDKNFHIDSTGWEKVWRGWFGLESYLLNPEKDVCEFLRGKFKGEQLFTWLAARRETERAGKIMMDSVEWPELKEISSDMPNIVLAGRFCVRVYRGVGNLSGFEGQGKLACFWLGDDYKSYHSNNASCIHINYNKRIECIENPKNYALSVRCLRPKDQKHDTKKQG